MKEGAKWGSNSAFSDMVCEGGGEGVTVNVFVAQCRISLVRPCEFWSLASRFRVYVAG